MSSAAVVGPRLTRALGFGSVTMLMAVVAHWFGSGTVASPDVLAGSLAGSTLVGWAVVPRRGAGIVVLSVVALQVVLHAAFCLAMSGSGMTSGMGARMGSVVKADSLPMVVGHLAAAAASGWWMHAGERLTTELRHLLAVVLAPCWAGIALVFLAVDRRAPAKRSATPGSATTLRGRSVAPPASRGPPRAVFLPPLSSR